MLHTWVTRSAPLDPVDRSKVTRLELEPAQHTAKAGECYSLRVRDCLV